MDAGLHVQIPDKKADDIFRRKEKAIFMGKENLLRVCPMPLTT